MRSNSKHDSQQRTYGQCTCFSKPHEVCNACERIWEYQHQMQKVSRPPTYYGTEYVAEVIDEIVDDEVPFDV